MPNEGVTLAEAEAALDRELAALVEAGPDPARLSRIKARLRADRVYDLDRIQSRARQFGVALVDRAVARGYRRMARRDRCRDG
jgi:zinc protease